LDSSFGASFLAPTGGDVAVAEAFVGSFLTKTTVSSV